MRISLVVLVKASCAEGSPQQLACSPQTSCPCRHGKHFLMLPGIVGDEGTSHSGV